MSPRTCNGYLTKLRNLLDWAQAEGVVEATLGGRFISWSVSATIMGMPFAMRRVYR